MSKNNKKNKQYRKSNNFESSSSQFDSFRQEQNLSMKKVGQESINRVRIIQNNLLFINGLPFDLSSKELLETDLYFGRYGKVLKIIVNPPTPFKKNVTYQAYVTYQSQIDASLAIVALDGFKLSQRHLKASYGTTKYCSHFIKGYDCPNTDCYFLHKIDGKRQIINGDSRTIFKQQNNAAIDTVCNNLQEIIRRSLTDPNDNIFDGFPTLKQMLDFLVESNVLTKSQVENTKQKIKTKPIPINQPNKNKYIQPENKIIKSNSLSTTQSPSKISIDNQFKQNKNIYSKIQQKSIQIDQKIEKLILKQLLKAQKYCKSRFQFVHDQSNCKIQQINQIKFIFQKYLAVEN